MVATAKAKAAAAKRRSTAQPAIVHTPAGKPSQPSRARGKAQPQQATESIVTKLLAQSQAKPAVAVPAKPSRALVWGTPTEPQFSAELIKEATRVANETVSSILNEDLKKDDEAGMLEMYRLLPGHPGLSVAPPTAYPVRDYEGNAGWDDCLSGELGFPSAFQALDLTDKSCILRRTEAQLVKEALGEQPTLRKRKQGVPAGLRNLGATCYMNSLLQYLFFNAHFRSVMLMASSDVPAILELQRVFALLLRGEQKTVDPTKFVEAAAINASEEADATEFSSLLLDFLDAALKGQSSSLFKGELSKVMTCQENPAHRSSKVETFEELRAAPPQADGCSTASTTVLSQEGKVQEGIACIQGEKIKPKKSTAKKKVHLEQLLQATSFADEVFDGDNLYACGQCDNKKVVAKQTVHLQKAPPYLHVRFERYKFDAKKHTRTKLNLLISFPKAMQLRVRPEGQDASDVVYDCVGYLEHVSDSAHSGHYTATLFHEDASEGVQSSTDTAAPDTERQGPPAGSSTTTAENVVVVEPDAQPAAGEPPQKKRRVEGARKGTWWKMDDCTVGRVQWVDCTSGEAQVPLDDTPQRITSPSAYLLLYRRRDYDAEPEVRQIGAALPGSLESFLEGHNGKFQKEQESYKVYDAQLQNFAKRRLQEVEALRSAFRKTPRGTSPSDYLVVPNSWLRAFMRGEDCKDCMEDQSAASDESLFKAKPPLHRPILLPRRRDTDGAAAEDPAEVLDPLAVWCGEATLLPKGAVDDAGWGSNFASASQLLSPDACAKVRHLWCCWSEEFNALSNVEGSRVMAADLRMQPNNQILLTDTVWLSRKTWNRFSKLVAKGTSKMLRWKLFLEEVSVMRWGSCSEQTGDEKENQTDKPESTELEGGKSFDESALSSAAQASPYGVKELLLYDGILCDHGKVSKPKSGFLVPRGMLEDLLKCAREKEKAYKALWGTCRGILRCRTGHQEQRLVASDDVCEMCCPEWATHCATPSRHSRSGAHKLTETCMLFLSKGGASGTPHTLEVPWEDGRAMTGSWLRKIASAQVGFEIGELYVAAGKEQRLLRDDEVMDFLPPTLRANMRSPETIPEPEGDAFNNSIFLGRR